MSFDKDMQRLFYSQASDKSYKSMNRLDLFKVLYDDRQQVIDQLTKERDILMSYLELQAVSCSSNRMMLRDQAIKEIKELRDE